MEHEPERPKERGTVGPGGALRADPPEDQPPPSSEKSQGRRRWGKLTGAAFGALGTVLAALAGALVGAPWFPEIIGFRTSGLHVERAILYAKVLFFEDRARGKPILAKHAGHAGSASARRADLYDEGLYVKALYLRPHKVEKMHFEAHSSGTVNVTPIIPSSAEFDLDAYDKSQSKILPVKLDIRGRNYVLVATHYYNGFQYNPANRKYESDGGMHIDFPTDEAILIFDFSGLEHARMIRPEPKVYLATPDRPKKLIASTYVNGILVSESVKNPSVGSQIIADWEWSTER